MRREGEGKEEFKSEEGSSKSLSKQIALFV